MIPRPSRLVLLGHPVRHSLSPVFQTAALRSAGLPIIYEAIDVAPSELAERLRALVAARAAGNVTIPHKETVATLCDDRTPLATRTDAVNTFWVDARGRLVGDNTDVAGFAHLAREALGGELRDLRIALLGAGGAAAAVLAAVEQWPECEVVLYGRTPARRDRLAARFAAFTRTADDAESAVRACDLVVNATPIGLHDTAIPVRVEALEQHATVVDLVYRPGGTVWVRAARARRLRAADGLGMLLEQGALAFERWFGMSAPRDVMRRAVEGAMQCA